MNSKIKNYVDVLFKGIPVTKKAMELKEEILSNLNEHFEAHLAEGKSENQAYTDSLADLGDIDALLKDLEPEQNLKEKIDLYREKRAKNISISVMLYILSVVVLIGFGALSAVFGIGQEEKMGVIGLICMFILIAIATGLIIYTRMSIPQDVAQYIAKDNHSNIYNYDGSNKSLRFLAAFMKIYWIIVLIIYLAVSFKTGAWYITWLIWIIGTAIKNAIFIMFDVNDDQIEKFSDR